jgi:hypothetical protein
MQVRHIEQQQLDLVKIEKAQLEQVPGLQDEKPWEEVVECLALLAAIHMNPCQNAAGRRAEEEQEPKKDDEPSPPPAP